MPWWVVCTRVTVQQIRVTGCKLHTTACPELWQQQQQVAPDKHSAAEQTRDGEGGFLVYLRTPGVTQTISLSPTSAESSRHGSLRLDVSAHVAQNVKVVTG